MTQNHGEENEKQATPGGDERPEPPNGPKSKPSRLPSLPRRPGSHRSTMRPTGAKPPTR